MAGYEPIETASIDELRTLQTERLQSTLHNAYANIDHYTRAFDAAGVHPDDVTSLDDLARLPFLVKDDLREAYPFGMFAVPREDLVRVHASSGTTGKPTVVGYTAADIDTWATVMARSLFAAGGRPGDLLHNAYGYGLFTGGLGAHYGGEKLGCTVVPFGGGQTERQIQLITDFEPRLITVTPSYCLNLIEEMERLGIDPAATSLQVGIFGAEPWTEGMRTEIEERLGIDAVDIYGLSEVIGPGVLRSVSRPRTASPSGRTTSTRKSSIPRPATSCPMAKKANSSSPRSRSTRSPSSDTELAISPRCCPARHAPCGASPGSPAAATTC